MYDRIEDFVYDKNLVDYAQSLLDEIRSDVTDTDYLLYDAVMKIGYANGFENVEATNSSYDIRNVEKLMEQCRDQTTNLSSTLEDQIGVIEGFLYDSPTDSKLLKNTTTSVNTATSSSSSSTANRVGDGVNQLMYGPPSNTSNPPAEPPSDSEDPPVQALYGPPNDPVQVLYGPPSEPKSNEVPVVQLPNNDVPKGATAVINDSIPVIRDGVSAQETFAPSGQAPGQEPSQPQQPSAPSDGSQPGQEPSQPQQPSEPSQPSDGSPPGQEPSPPEKPSEPSPPSDGSPPGQEPEEPQRPSAPSGNTSSGQSNTATNQSDGLTVSRSALYRESSNESSDTIGTISGTDNSNNFTLTRSVHNSAADGDKMGTISGTDNLNNFTLTRSVHNSAADGGKITGYTAGSLAAALGAASLKGISNKFKFDDDEKEE